MSNLIGAERRLASSFKIPGKSAFWLLRLFGQHNEHKHLSTLGSPGDLPLLRGKAGMDCHSMRMKNSELELEHAIHTYLCS
jgi:hypothetical protein